MEHDELGDAPVGPVVVVGAGLSGCACAAALATGGVPVLLVNSALDGVGLPGYGPVIATGPGWMELERVLTGLPAPLRRAWLRAAAVIECSQGILIVDRRSLGLETKRALEYIPGLQVRQALVTGVHPWGTCSSGEDRRRSVLVETVFGERLIGRACVLAVGLGLGGRVRVGEDVLGGGRYGEVAADRLRDDLVAAGVGLHRVTVQVGPRVSGGALDRSRGAERKGDRMLDGRVTSEEKQPGEDGWAGMPIPAAPVVEWVSEAGDATCRDALRDVLSRAVGSTEDDLSDEAWPAGFPPSPYYEASLRSGRGALNDSGRMRKRQRDRCDELPPDGLALDEYYQEPGRPAAVLAMEAYTWTRAGHEVSGEVIEVLAQDGRVPSLDGVWAAGQVAGARTYLESLSSGLTVAAAVRTAVSERIDE